MGMNLTAVRAKVKTVTVEWDGENVDVGYHPAAVTPAHLEAVVEAAKTAQLEPVGQMLAPILAWWDVYETEEDQGDPSRRIAPTAAAIQRFPLAFTMAVLAAVQGDMKPEGSKG